MFCGIIQCTFALLFRSVLDISCCQSFLKTLSVFFIVCIVSRTYATWKESRLYPPGPWGVPVLGYLPFIKKDLHEELTCLSRKYGPVFSLKMGSELMIVLSDHKVIREAFRREEFTARPDNPFMQILDGYGLINIEGKLWKDQRKFLHERLRHFGMKEMGNGREIMEARIMTEVESFLENLANEKASPVDVGYYLSSAVSNVICSILMSVRFRHDDPRFIRFTTLMDEGFRIFTAIAAAIFIPVLRFLPAITRAYNKIVENRREIGQFYTKIVDVHKKTFDANNTRDIIDSYLLEINKAKAEGRHDALFCGKDADRQMEQIIGDLFSAGSETVKTTLQWASIFALRHPDMQQKIHVELDRVVGRSRLPSLDDLPNLPYTEAFLCEVMRRVTAVPLGTTHATTRTTSLNGHVIPKGTQVVPLLHAVNMNPSLWKEPEQFSPERFLSVDGKVHKPEFFIPFGVGRRVCLGHIMARAELFLFFSSLLHVFTLEVPDGTTTPTLRGHAGVTFTPEKFLVCTTRREST